MEHQEDKSSAIATTATTWKLWRVYTIRLVIFTVVASFLQRLGELGYALWTQKFHLTLNLMVGLTLLGLVLVDITFGLLWSLMFTPMQNTFNTPRVRWKSWMFLIATFLVTKFFLLGAFSVGWKIFTRM